MNPNMKSRFDPVSPDTMTIYSLLAIYTWVLIEGAYLHSLVLTAFHNGGGVTKMKYFAPFGWLFPLIITIIWIGVNVQFRHPESICWDSNMIEPRVANFTLQEMLVQN